MRAEDPRRSKKRSSPERPSGSVPSVQPALECGAIQLDGVADPDDDAKQRIMRMAAQVNAGKLPAMAAVAASAAVGNAGVGRATAAAQAAAPAASREAAAGSSSATAQGFNSWLREMHRVRHAHRPAASDRTAIKAAVVASADSDSLEQCSVC